MLTDIGRIRKSFTTASSTRKPTMSVLMAVLMRCKIEKTKPAFNQMAKLLKSNSLHIDSEI